MELNMSNITSDETTVMIPTHDPITIPYPKQQGALEKLLGKDEVLNNIGRDVVRQKALIAGNVVLAKAVTDAQRELGSYQRDAQEQEQADISQHHSTMRKMHEEAEDDLQDDIDALWVQYHKKKEHIERTEKDPEIKDRRLKRLLRRYEDKAESFERNYSGQYKSR